MALAATERTIRCIRTLFLEASLVVWLPLSESSEPSESIYGSRFGKPTGRSTPDVLGGAKSVEDDAHAVRAELAFGTPVTGLSLSEFGQGHGFPYPPT